MEEDSDPGWIGNKKTVTLDGLRIEEDSDRLGMEDIVIQLVLFS